MYMYVQMDGMKGEVGSGTSRLNYHMYKLYILMKGWYILSHQAALLACIPPTVPKLPNPTWNQTFDLERDHVTGLVDVTYTLTLTSHCKSIAILYSIEGILITQARDNNHVVIQYFRDKRNRVTVSTLK